MPNESEPEEKLKLPTLVSDDLDKNPDKSGEPTKLQGQALAAKKFKWGNRLRQSGTKFPAKMVSKELKGPIGSGEGEAPTGEAVTELTPTPGQASNVVEPEPQALKAPKPEGWESSVPPPSIPVKAAGRPGEVKPKPHRPDRLLRRTAARRNRLIYTVLGGLLVVVVFSFLFWNFGFRAGIQSSLENETKEKASASKQFLADLDQALADLRAGNTDQAVKKLRELEDAKSPAASVTYLLAVAAVQNGDIPLAAAKIAESISKRERISDSLALQAVLETQKASDPSLKKFGDTQIRSEALLRQAMLADQANPFPMVELATLLRYQKRTDEALALLRGARSRLNPVDSHSVVDVTIALAALQETPDDQLPQIADPGKDLVKAFSSAYVAMRKGDFTRAAADAKTARKLTAPDLFDYLINDPAIRRYAGEQNLKEFFQ